MSNTTTDGREGWAYDVTSGNRNHYYKDGHSLCGRALAKPYMRNFDTKSEGYKFAKDCTYCIKKLKEMKDQNLTTDREKALAWWDNLSRNSKNEYSDIYFLPSKVGIYQDDIQYMWKMLGQPAPLTEEGEKELKCTPGKDDIEVMIEDGKPSMYIRKVSDGEIIGEVPDIHEADKIVKSYNCHDDLVKALELMVRDFGDDANSNRSERKETLKIAAETLAKASTK